MKIFFLAIGFVLLFAGCSSTKITSTPYAGYRMHEQLVIMPVAGLGELENDRLLQWSDAVLGRDLIFLKTIPYQDAYYQSKQHHLTLPEFN
ncbi:MAG TPA: hypothetical protein VFM90_03490, partial [Cyclobacteriaceae bacterium]|nr:hypothetical protein [Cyclobacteriaceae bacterium]